MANAKKELSVKPRGRCIPRMTCFFLNWRYTGLFNYTPAQFNCSRYDQFQASEYGLYVV